MTVTDYYEHAANTVSKCIAEHGVVAAIGIVETLDRLISEYVLEQTRRGSSVYSDMPRPTIGEVLRSLGMNPPNVGS